MSIYRLKNMTGTDSFQAWAGNAGFTFPHGVAIDLIDEGIYNSVPYLIGIRPDELHGSTAGSRYESVATLIRSSQWRLNDGDADLSKVDALHLLKYARPFLTKVESSFSGLRTRMSAKTHNLANTSEWPVPPNADWSNLWDARWTLTPASGKVIIVKGSHAMIDPRLIFNNVQFFFRIYAGPYLVNQEIYDGAKAIYLGAAHGFVSPQIGDITTTGAPPYAHAIYDYRDDPIPLYSSLGMRLEVGLERLSADDKIELKTKDALLRIHFWGASLSEV